LALGAIRLVPDTVDVPKLTGRDPVWLALGAIGLGPDTADLPKLIETVQKLVALDRTGITAGEVYDIATQLRYRVSQIDVLCFGSSSKACADARAVLARTAAERREIEDIANGPGRPMPG
jgi:hypothetical protein